MRSIMLAVSAAIFLLPVSAHAARGPASGPVQQWCGERYGACAEPSVGKVQTAKRQKGRQSRHRTAKGAIRMAQDGAQPAAVAYTAVFESGGAAQVVEHPAGCPRRAFCGCGTSLYLLGKAVARGGLAIASNWLGFPRAEPGPGMAAARRGHVFAIVKVIAPGVVLAYDANSGGHRTHIHVRSLRGYVVVNPHGANRYASAS